MVGGVAAVVSAEGPSSPADDVMARCEVPACERFGKLVFDGSRWWCPPVHACSRQDLVGSVGGQHCSPLGCQWGSAQCPALPANSGVHPVPARAGGVFAVVAALLALGSAALVLAWIWVGDYRFGLTGLVGLVAAFVALGLSLRPRP